MVVSPDIAGSHPTAAPARRVTRLCPQNRRRMPRLSGFIAFAMEAFANPS